MTSGSLFFKLTFRDIKRRIWCPILIGLIFFLFMEVVCLMTFQSLTDPANFGLVQTPLQFFRDYFVAVDTNITCHIMMIISAVICGLSNFTYMNSKKQIDLYHSLPVHRSVLFFSRLLSGALCFVIPFLFNVIITCFIALGRQALDITAVKRLFLFIIFEVIYFLSIYAVVTLAVMLTGNLVLNVMGSAVLLSYSPILWGCVMAMNATFFDTFVPQFYKGLICFSPIEDMIECISRVSRLRSSQDIISYGPVLPNLLIESIVTILLILLSWYLFRKRPSEAAGKSIVFRVTEPIIKTAIVIPISLLCGVFFMEASNNMERFSWFIFGAAFGFIILGIVIEIIFRLDFKSAFCHWKQLVLNLVVLIVIICIYKLDLFGYDRFVPNRNRVQSMAVSIEYLDTQMNYYENYVYTDSTEYRLGHMQITELDVPYELASLAASHDNFSEEEQIEETHSFATTSEYLASRMREEEHRRIPITVAYTQKNGKNIYRQYILDKYDEKSMELLNQLYCMKEYKEAVFPIYEDDEADYFKMECNETYNMHTVKFNEEERKEFLKLYKEDLSHLSLQEIQETLPVGTLDFYVRKTDKWNNSYYYDCVYGYPVYESFTNTIAWLKGKDVDYTKQDGESRVTSIQVYNYNQSVMNDAGWEECASVTYEDPETIAELVKHITCTFDLCSDTFMPVETGIEVDVTYDSADGAMYKTFFFKKDEIPSFVVDDLDAYVPSQEDSEEY